jgi:hypothetical protein
MTWKTKVSKANVLLFQLQASVHGINENESGSSPITYPTPTAMDHIDRKGMRPSRAATNRKTGYLSEMIKMYPTPTQDSASERTKKYSQGGMPLPMAVKMFPTPSASCHMDVVAPPETVTQNNQGWSVTRVGTGTKFGAKLNDVVNKLEVEMYPTPVSRDYKDAAYNITWKESRDQKSSLPRQVLKDNKPGGKLNPNFVEFLMGYPMNWTKIDPTE